MYLDLYLKLKWTVILRNLGPVWYCYLNNNFHCLNTIICIFITLFYLHIFSQHLNNVTKNLLSKQP